MSQLDALFKEINSMPLTANVPTKITGTKLRGKNELPLMSQSIANSIATVAWALSSPIGQRNIQKTIETSVKRKFLPYVNAAAAANQKSLHHVYEWGRVGQTSARLFDLKIPSSSRGKANFSMRLNFKPSKSLVPLTEAQQTPGPTGKVVQRVHVFYNKAMVMEYGQMAIVRPKNSKYLAFDSPVGARKTLSGLTFSSRPIAINYAKMSTSGALNAVISSFFKGVGGQSVDQSINKYSNRVAAGSRKASHMINISTPSSAYANAVASRVSQAIGAYNG